MPSPTSTSGTLSSRLHSGWDPDGALLSVYSFPSDCSSSTGTWLEGTETTCQPLTGDYYSPAICPNGWTAAYTRDMLGGKGPPVEADETAMYCCPSGMDSALGSGCGEGVCVSTSLLSLGSSYSIELLMSRPAVQIRWASSDLSLFATHPLTPGLTLNSNIASTDYPVLPTLETRDQVGLVLALIPLLVTLAGILGAFIILRSRRKNETLAQPGNFFRPWILRRRVIIFLIALMTSALILVEISCHLLPQGEDVWNAKSLSTRSVTKVYISEITVKRAELNSTGDYTMTCSLEGDYTFSYVTTQDRGSTVRESTIVPLSTGAEPTTICRTEGQLVELPTCYQPATAPNPDDFLDDTDPTFKGGSFIGTILAPLSAALFAIPWKILAIHAASLEPFHQLSRPCGTSISSLLREYQSMGALFAPLPGICQVMTYTTAAIAPLAVESWKVKLEGNCDESNSKGCAPVVIVSTAVARVLEVLLALNIVLAVCMLVILNRWSTGLQADPRSILGVASLSHSPHFLGLFTSFPKKAKWWQWWKKSEQDRIILHYGYNMGDATGQRDFGILVANASDMRIPNNAPTAGKSSHDVARQEFCSPQTHQFPLKKVIVLSFVTLGLMILLAIIIYYRLNPDTQALGRFLSSQSFGPRFVFSIVGVVINFFWVSIFTKYLLFAPYLELIQGSSVSSQSIALPYASDPYTYLVTRIKSFRYLAVGVCLSVIFSDFLPLTLANIPFDRANTWDTYEASSWVSAVLIAISIITLLSIISILLFQPRSRFISTKAVQKSPLQFILHTINNSPGLMESLHSLSESTTRERDRRVAEFDARYKLIGTNFEGELKLRPRIEAQ